MKTRREFLQQIGGTALGLAAWGAFPALGGSLAFGDTGNGTKVLFVNLNGGIDGLYVCQPLAGATHTTLSSLRPTLTQNPNSLLALDGTFGLNPNLPILKTLFDEGHFTMIANVGYQNMTRSHLESEIAFARGVADRLDGATGGFINRMGSSFGWNSLQAVSVTGADRAFSGGQYRGIQVNGLSQFRFAGDNTQSSSENSYRKEMLYNVAADWVVDPNKSKQKDMLEGLELAANTSDTVQTAYNSASFTVTYPNTYFGKSFRDVDVLFSSPLINAQVGYLRRVGFDTHSNQAAGLQSTLTELNNALSAFVTNMKSKGLWNNMIVCIYSEFGRTCRENGSGGTDHGGGNHYFMTGGAVKPAVLGSVLPADLTTLGWLPVKYNVVEIYRAIVARMGYDPNQVFGEQSSNLLPGLFT